MSRTRRGSKYPGYDYWSPRPFNQGGQPPGAFAKKRTHKAERQQAVDLIDEAMTELDTPDDLCFICHRSHPWESDEDACEQAVIDALQESQS